MDKIKFLRYYTEYGYRYHTDNSNMFLMSLAEFLLTEVVCFGGSSWIDSLEKLKDGGGISGNMIDIERKENNLYLSYLYDDLDDPFQALEISKKEFFKLIKMWEKLMKEKPEEIILVRDKGKFELIGKNLSNENHA